MTDRDSGCARKDFQRAVFASGLKVAAIATLEANQLYLLSTMAMSKQKLQCGKRYQTKKYHLCSEIFMLKFLLLWNDIKYRNRTACAEDIQIINIF